MKRLQRESRAAAVRFSGTMLHYSNDAMVGSLIESGRPNVARTLMNSLDPPQLMRAREAAALVDLRLEAAAGRAGHGQGLATSEPDPASGHA